MPPKSSPSPPPPSFLLVPGRHLLDIGQIRAAAASPPLLLPPSRRQPPLIHTLAATLLFYFPSSPLLHLLPGILRRLLHRRRLLSHPPGSSRHRHAGRHRPLLHAVKSTAKRQRGGECDGGQQPPAMPWRRSTTAAQRWAARQQSKTTAVSDSMGHLPLGSGSNGHPPRGSDSDDHHPPPHQATAAVPRPAPHGSGDGGGRNTSGRHLWADPPSPMTERRRRVLTSRRRTTGLVTLGVAVEVSCPSVRAELTDVLKLLYFGKGALTIRTTRGLVLVHGDLIGNGHLLEHGEQLHLHHVLWQLSHELLHDLFLYSAQTSTNSHGGDGDDSSLDTWRASLHDQLPSSPPCS
uniref:Uncharacterized protein n=1 Tax=Oryza punctata TaxID=4537 RepID=A0A0E0M016_ORYPU